MANFLLIHGAWQGAWAWDNVAARLTDRGHTAYALDLPGSGGDPTPASEVTMDLYADAILREAKRIGTPDLVLVGHSMGGAAITAAASLSPAAFTRLVYVCAFLPAPGQSIGELGARSHAMGIAGPQVEVVQGGVAAQLIESTIASTFLNDCEPDVIRHAVPLFKPQPIGPIMALAAEWSDGFRNLPKRYVSCSFDRAIHPALQDVMAEAAGIDDRAVLDSGHEPFLSCADRLVDYLVV